MFELWDLPLQEGRQSTLLPVYTCPGPQQILRWRGQFMSDTCFYIKYSITYLIVVLETRVVDESMNVKRASFCQCLSGTCIIENVTYLKVPVVIESKILWLSNELSFRNELLIQKTTYLIVVIESKVVDDNVIVEWAGFNDYLVNLSFDSSGSMTLSRRPSLWSSAVWWKMMVSLL